MNESNEIKSMESCTFPGIKICAYSIFKMSPDKNNINPKYNFLGRLDSNTTTFATTKVKSSLCCGTKS